MSLTVHFMQYGHTACMMAGLPKDWAAGHRWSGDWNDVTCEQCLRGREPIDTFTISEDGKSITCKRCNRTSYSRGDIENRWCAYCQVSHDDLWPPARLWWIETLEPDMVGLHCSCGWKLGLKRKDLEEFKHIALGERFGRGHFQCPKCKKDLVNEVKELK
jgi:hypothetical protein